MIVFAGGSHIGVVADRAAAFPAALDGGSSERARIPSAETRNTMVDREWADLLARDTAAAQ
jgi:hypothetical protein